MYQLTMARFLCWAAAASSMSEPMESWRFGSPSVPYTGWGCGWLPGWTETNWHFLINQSPLSKSLDPYYRVPYTWGVPNTILVRITSCLKYVVSNCKARVYFVRAVLNPKRYEVYLDVFKIVIRTTVWRVKVNSGWVVKIGPGSSVGGRRW